MVPSDTMSNAWLSWGTSWGTTNSTTMIVLTHGPVGSNAIALWDVSDQVTRARARQAHLDLQHVINMEHAERARRLHVRLPQPPVEPASVPWSQSVRAFRDRTRTRGARGTHARSVRLRTVRTAT